MSSLSSAFLLPSRSPIICAIAKKKAAISEIAANLKNFKTGFIAYAIDYEYYPDDCHTDSGPYSLPNTTIEDYILVDKWVTPAALGGRYNWEGPDTYWDSDGYLGISIDGRRLPTRIYAFWMDCSMTVICLLENSA